MADKGEGLNRDNPEQSDALSATGMFLRAFESSPRSSGEAQEPPQPSARPATDPGELLGAKPGEAPAGQAAPPSSQTSSPPGEFTQMFQAARAQSRVAPARPEPAVQAQAAPSPPDAPAPSEFTRVFVSGKSSAASAPATSLDEPPRPVSVLPVTPGRAKGFSTPGLSDSASGGGSFTQFLKSAAASPPPPQPGPDVASEPTRIMDLPKAQDIPRQSREISPPAEPSPSVTGLISSLSSQGGGHAGSPPPEPVPYRPVAASSFAPLPPSQPTERPADPGGVTRLIQKLAQEQATVSSAPPPSPATPTPPSDSGQGEFTRMISKLSVNNASAAAPPAPSPMPATPMVPAFPPVQVAPPAIPAPAPPAVVAPQIPRPAPVALPAAPKSKLESMVPILLVINTFLLLLLLVVVLFRAR